MKYHITKDGTKIKISDLYLSTDHLIKEIIKRYCQGIRI